MKPSLPLVGRRNPFKIESALRGLNPDDLVKGQNSVAKEKAPNSRRANPEDEAHRKVRSNDKGCSAMQPFGFAQGREHVERKLDFLRSHQP